MLSCSLAHSMQDERGHACSHVQLVSAYSRMVIMSSFTRRNAEAMQKASFIGVPVDVRRGAGMDLNSPAGMALAVLLLLSIVQGGLIGGGPPCSSFVWISR